MKDGNDMNLHHYQDNLDTEGVDEITHETTDNPQGTTGVPDQALKPELDKLAFDETGRSGGDDEREQLEDMDQGDLENPDQRTDVS